MLYFYIGCLTFGVGYALLSSILGGDHHISHGHVDIGGHEGADGSDIPSPFNPLVLASAITTFGAVGTISKMGFGMDDLLSAVFALAFALGIGALIFFFVVKLIYGSQSDSTFSLQELVGNEAVVITPIPAQGMGEIAVTIRGVRYNFTAKSIGGKPLERGETARIKAFDSSIAIVSRIVTLDTLDAMTEEESETSRKNSDKNFQGGNY